MSGFEDDSAFNNLAKQPFSFHRLSWHCNLLECPQCDGRIHYNVKRFKAKIFSAKTGQERDEYEDIAWNTNHNQVQLEHGVLQSRENTPEGSKCECFCHKPRPKGAGPPQFTQGQDTIDKKAKGKKRHEMLTVDEKRSLK